MAQAAQAGCALVLSDIATFRELWDGAAMFVAPGNDAALAHELRALGADERRCAALGVAASRRAEHYTAGAMGTAMLEVYRDVLGAYGAPKAVA